MFLQSRVELGTSLETAEDLLMEHQEFEIRAKVRLCDCHLTSRTSMYCTVHLYVDLPYIHQRTAEEVHSLLAKSEEMLSIRHFASSELRDRAWDLNSLHNNFESRLQTRGKALNDTVTFYRNADEVIQSMCIAGETCDITYCIAVSIINSCEQVTVSHCSE